MNPFWIWFWRPIAEFLGTIALFAVVVVGLVAFGAIWMGVSLLADKIKGKPK